MGECMESGVMAGDEDARSKYTMKLPKLGGGCVPRSPSRQSRTRLAGQSASQRHISIHVLYYAWMLSRPACHR